MSYRKLLIALVVAVVAIYAEATSAFGNLYVLRHPRRERCKSHYVKKTRMIKLRGRKTLQTVCQYKAAEPAETPSRPTWPTAVSIHIQASGPANEPLHVSVSASVERQGSGPGRGVVGVPVVLTLENAATSQQLTSFTVQSFTTPCAIVTSKFAITTTGRAEALTWWILTGEPVGSIPGCPMEAVITPLEQGVDIRGSFAGNGTFAPATSEWERPEDLA